MADKPWDGRFTEKTDRVVEAFTSSIGFDRRLYAYDIKGSIAHCRMLAARSIISEDEASQIVEGLGRIATIIREAGESLQRNYGAGAAEILFEAMDEARREVDRCFGEQSVGGA